MRRNLLASLLLLAPALGLAQSTTPTAGTISTDAATINIAQCTGTAFPGIALADTMNLTWSTTIDTAAETNGFLTTGSYQLYAANQAVAAGVTTGSFDCTVLANTSSATALVEDTVGDAFTSTQQVWSTPKAFSRAAMVAAAGFDCTANHTVYLCMQWLDATPAKKGFATTTVTITTDRPAVPTDVVAGPGDGRLHLSWKTGSGGTTATSYQVVVNDGTTDVKNVTFTGTSGDVGGLKNLVTYHVTVYALTAAGNPSLTGATADGTPQPVDDFWDVYRGKGGQETGGCSGGPGDALALLGAIAALFAVRRRKS